MNEPAPFYETNYVKSQEPFRRKVKKYLSEKYGLSDESIGLGMIGMRERTIYPAVEDHERLADHFSLLVGMLQDCKNGETGEKDVLLMLAVIEEELESRRFGIDRKLELILRTGFYTEAEPYLTEALKVLKREMPHLAVGL